MNQNDARLYVAALAQLQKSVTDLAGIMQQNAQREADADKKLPPELVAKLGADAAMSKQYREKQFSYDPEGNLRNSANASGNSDVGGRSSGTGAKIGAAVADGMRTTLKAATAPIFALLSPMSILAQIVTSSASGFQVLTFAVKLFAATIGPILLPVFAVLAAGLVYLSDTIWNDISPELEGFYDVIVGSFLPAVGAMVDALKWAHDQITDVFEALDPFSDTPDELKAMAGGAPGTGKGVLAADTGSSGYDGGDYGSGGFTGSGAGSDHAGSGGPGGPSIGGSFGEVLRELRASMGPKASFSGIAQVSRNAQLAALNDSPFESKMLDRMAQGIGALERILAKLHPGLSV
jgi:hypothetical protein